MKRVILTTDFTILVPDDVETEKITIEVNPAAIRVATTDMKEVPLGAVVGYTTTHVEEYAD